MSYYERQRLERDIKNLFSNVEFDIYSFVGMSIMAKHYGFVFDFSDEFLKRLPQLSFYWEDILNKDNGFDVSSVVARPVSDLLVEIAPLMDKHQFRDLAPLLPQELLWKKFVASLSNLCPTQRRIHKIRQLYKQLNEPETSQVTYAAAMQHVMSDDLLVLCVPREEPVCVYFLDGNQREYEYDCPDDDELDQRERFNF